MNKEKYYSISYEIEQPCKNKACLANSKGECCKYNYAYGKCTYRR